MTIDLSTTQLSAPTGGLLPGDLTLVVRGAGGGSPQFFEYVQPNGPALLLSANATFDTSTPIFGSGALNGGTASAIFNQPAGSMTAEFFFRAAAAPSVAAEIFMQTDAAGRLSTISVGTTGLMTVSRLGSTTNPSKNNVTICDGNVHHICLQSSQSAGSNCIYLDGVQLFDSGVTYQYPGLSSLGLFAAGGYGATNFGCGEIDEVRISSVARYTGALNGSFTAPSAPFVWDSSTLGLWHLDGNGNSG